MNTEPIRHTLEDEGELFSLLETNPELGPRVAEPWCAIARLRSEKFDSSRAAFRNETYVALERTQAVIETRWETVVRTREREEASALVTVRVAVGR